MYILAIAGLTRFHTGNWILDKFFEGGPVMWPILIVSIIAVTVILERIVWWSRLKTLRETKKLEKIFLLIEQNDIKGAIALAHTSQDPRIRVIYSGLQHSNVTLQSALQVACGVEVQRASRFLTVMDTIVTLAPLLGLLGTVTGIMAAFDAVRDTGLDPSAVSGGIGEALIATACGLGIAMMSLIPYNYFSNRVEHLKFELETVATNLEVLMTKLNIMDKQPNEVEFTHTS